MLNGVWAWLGRPGSRSVILYCLLFILCASLLLFHLGSSPSGLSAAELSTRNASQSIQQIYDNPINAPHNLVLFSLSKLGLGGLVGLRLSSVLPAIIFGLAFYAIVRPWFGRMVGLFGTLLFISTPLFIISAKVASAEIMFFSAVLVYALYNWLLKPGSRSGLAFFLLIAVVGIVIYTPGLILWILLATIFAWQRVSKAIEDVPYWVVGLGFLILLLIVFPLGISAARNWHSAEQLLLIPASWPSPLTILKNIAWMPVALFIKTPSHETLILGTLPVVNIVQLTLMVFGVFAMWSAARAKSITLLASIVFGILVAGVNNHLALLIFCLPAIGIFVTAGLRYLYIEWRSVFPLNPIPKSLAFTLMLLVILVSCFYGLTYSLVAWPHSVSTTNTYVLK